MEKITLGGKTYQVVSKSASGMDLKGPRGAGYCLVQNLKNPTLFAFFRTNTLKPLTTWYRKDGEKFTEID